MGRAARLRHVLVGVLVSVPMGVLVGCATPARAPEPQRARHATASATHAAPTFLAYCRVATDQPAIVHERLVLLARLDGGLAPVTADASLAALAWTPLGGLAAPRALTSVTTAATAVQMLSLEQGGAVLVAGACRDGGQLWATAPLERVARPTGVDADAADAVVAARATASAQADVAEQGNTRDTSFTEENVQWLRVGALLVRVSLLREGWTECEPPSAATGDSVCGSSDEERVLVVAVSAGRAATVEVLVSANGC